ncbi:hypothetical protein ES705_39929 [subsurface metagenome]
MILKLRTGIDSNTSWKLIDKIKQVDYKYIDEPKEFGKSDYYINNFPDVENKRIVQITAAFENGLNDVIFTDDMVYVLNDAGKTCDTINI